MRLISANNVMYHAVLWLGAHLYVSANTKVCYASAKKDSFHTVIASCFNFHDIEVASLMRSSEKFLAR